MDRTMTKGKGFTLLEVMIVTAIVGIVSSIAIFSFARIMQNQSIDDDMHRISTFLKGRRLTAFTVKQSITITANNNGDIAATMGGNNAVTILSLNNPVEFAPSSFTINSRGLFTSQGNIHLTTVNNSAPNSCVAIATERIRLGEWDGTNCNAK